MRASGFLAAPAEDEWIAAFQAHDDLAELGFFDQQGIDLILGERDPSFLFTRIDEFRSRSGESQEPFIGQMVVDDDVRPFQPIFAAQG